MCWTWPWRSWARLGKSWQAAKDSGREGRASPTSVPDDPVIRFERIASQAQKILRIDCQTTTIRLHIQDLRRERGLFLHPRRPVAYSEGSRRGRDRAGMGARAEEIHLGRKHTRKRRRRRLLRQKVTFPMPPFRSGNIPTVCAILRKL